MWVVGKRDNKNTSVVFRVVSDNSIHSDVKSICSVQHSGIHRLMQDRWGDAFKVGQLTSG